MGEVKFEKITKYKDIDFALPMRKTELSAGYDFVVPEDTIIPSHYAQLFKMIMAQLNSDEFTTGIAETDAIKILTEIGANQELFAQTDQIQTAARLIESMPELTEFLKEIFTLNLEQVKKLTKSTGTRMTLVPTGVKVKLKDNQKLELLIRSSTVLGGYLMMANSVGIIDADYYNNIDNEGHIHFQFINLSPFNIKLKKGEILGQGIITEYEKTTNDAATGNRIGGFGSTSV